MRTRCSGRSNPGSAQGSQENLLCPPKTQKPKHNNSQAWLWLSCGLFRYNFPNLSCAAMFFLEWLSPANLPNKPYVFSLFLIVLSWTLTFNMLTEACRVWDVISRIIAHSDLRWTCRDVHYEEDWQRSRMFFPGGQSLSLWNDGLITLPRLVGTNDCFFLFNK